jgi:uncharacterized protein YjiS (DUF1127 family)
LIESVQSRAARQSIESIQAQETKMAAIDTTHFVPSKEFHVSLASRIAGLLQAMRERRDERRTLAQLSHYDSRLLRDIGLDPDAIRYAARTAWDVEVR